MALTFEQVRDRLNVDEPNYDELKKMGVTVLPQLQKLAAGQDPMLASKATYLASVIKGKEASQVVAEAARSPHAVVRVAAASAAANLTAKQSDQVLEQLLDDDDVGVRKVTLRAVTERGSPKLRAKVAALAQADNEPLVRELAAQTLKNMSK